MAKSYHSLGVPVGDLVTAPPVGFLRFDGVIRSKQPRSFWRSAHGLSVVATIEGEGGPKPRLCVTVRHANRAPTWEELLAVKAVFYGDQEAMLEIPDDLDVTNVWCFRQEMAE